MGSGVGEAERDLDEGPVHRVGIGRGFWMGQFEVTRGEFDAFVRATGYRTEAEKEGWAYVWQGSGWKKVKGVSWREPGYEQSEAHPVVCVSWNDAQAFCAWLGGEEGRTYRFADGGSVGVCVSGGDADGVLFWRDDQHGPGELCRGYGVWEWW